MGRKRIGLQTSRLEYGYGVRIWQGAAACARERDADLIVFPGRNPDAPHGFDYQYNRIFNLMSRRNLDALILTTTLVSNCIDEAALLEFCSRFEGLPLVSIGMKAPIGPSIVIDNRSGIRAVVRHMAERHGAERIAFVRGPRDNWEANERFLAYRDEMESLGLPIDESLVAQGDFTTHGLRPALEGILRGCPELPDAFIFANDEMAIAGMHILREEGIGIPSETRIAGFDDIAEAATQVAPLTTIRQPLFELAHRAFEMALDIADGARAPGLTILPTEPVIRASCGCLAHCVDDLRALDLAIRGGAAPGAGRAACLELAMSVLKGGDFEQVGDVDAREAGMGAVLDGLFGLCGPGRGEEAPESGDDRFLALFGDLLAKEVRDGLSPGEWQYIVPVLADAIERSLGGEADSSRLRLLVRSCIVLAAESAQAARNAAANETGKLTLLLREAQYALSSIIREEDLVEAMKARLPMLGIPSFILSRFEKEWFHGPGTPWAIPGTSRLVALLADGADAMPGGGEPLAYPSDLVRPPGLVPEAARKTLVVYPLFFGELHYGAIAFEMTHEIGLVYESLATQVSSILRAISLYDAKERAEEELRQAMMELEDFNQQLSNLSLTDDLTGLYNRRGFMKLASRQLSLTRQMGKNALLIFGDIDGLKAINDTYGHEEGDFAIASAGEALRRVFRAMDIIARLGGDEFTVFASNTNEKQVTYFQARLAETLDAFNERSGKPYRLSMSLGCAECRPGRESKLGDYMREADAMLYARKAARSRRP